MSEDTISRKAAIDICNNAIDLWHGQLGEGIVIAVKKKIKDLPSAQPETHEERTETHTCDYINRKDAIEAHYEYCNKHPDASFPVWSLKILEDLPSAQPDSKELSFTQKKLDTISRQAAIRWVKTECNPYGKPTLDFESGKKVIEHLKQMPSAQPDMSEYSDKLWKKAYERGKAEALAQLEEAYISGETEAEARFHAQQRWIPCSEKLPEANGRYLVTRGLVAAGALWNRIYIANYSNLMGIKSVKIWWQGNVGKSDFERIDDVIAWMPLPETYREEGE